MIARSVSYGDIYELLAGLQFVNVSTEQRWREYRQAGREVVILLANRKPELPARPADLISVRRHLIDNGLLDRREFESLMPERP
jgi:hypothetical protein